MGESLGEERVGHKFSGEAVLRDRVGGLRFRPRDVRVDGAYGVLTPSMSVV